MDNNRELRDRFALIAFEVMLGSESHMQSVMRLQDPPTALGQLAYAYADHAMAARERKPDEES